MTRFRWLMVANTLGNCKYANEQPDRDFGSYSDVQNRDGKTGFVYRQCHEQAVGDGLKLTSAQQSETNANGDPISSSWNPQVRFEPELQLPGSSPRIIPG